MTRPPRPVLFALLLALSAAAVRAQNPRLALKLENVTVAEAAAELARASGVQIEISGTVPGAQFRSSYQWQDVSLARALRELCEKNGLRPNRRPGGYTLYAGAGAPVVPLEKRVGLVEKRGVRLFVESVSIDERRNLHFGGQAVDVGDSNLVLQFGAEVEEGDTDMIAGIENVTGKDDQGNVVVADQGRSYDGYRAHLFPDQWTGSVTFGSPHPKARKLVSLEGDLVTYRSVRPLRVEIPLPLEGKSVRREAGDWLIAVSQYQEVYQEPDDDDTGLPALGTNLQKAGPAVRVRVFHPSRPRTMSRTGWGVHPYLVGASGRIYTPVRSGGRGAGDGQLSLTDSFLVFPALAEKPAKLAWDLVERADPARLFSFRMTNIPLPAASPFVARATAPPGAPEGTAVPLAGPLHQKGGGTLASRVLIGERPAGAGILQLGLAVKTGAAWGPVRWTELETDADGAVTVSEVKPGAYRVLRSFRPAEPDAVRGEGRWLNREVTVQVGAGKTLALPPLQWSPAMKKK